MKIAFCVVCDIPLNRNMASTEKWRHTITGQVNFRLDLVLTYLSVQSNTTRIPNRNFRQCQFGLIEIYVHIFVLFSCSCLKKRELYSLPSNFKADAVFTYSCSACHCQSMKSPVELNSLFSKFFCYVTWFVLSRD